LRASVFDYCTSGRLLLRAATDSYLSSQSAWLVNYAKRYPAGLRVGTSVAEGTANFLVSANE
jgi:hypothetical protein